MTNPDEVHKLYHEAKRRASLPQQFVKLSDAESLLLSAPNNIIFELFNTILKETPAEKLIDFVKTDFKDYLNANWTTKIVQLSIKRLRREQTVDVRAGLKDVPLIRHRISPGLPKSPATRQQTSPVSSLATGSKHVSTERTGSGGRKSASRSPPVDYTSHTSKQVAIDQIYDHIMWRVQTDNVTQITSLLIKMMLDDSYKRGKLKVEVYDDIAERFKDWRADKLIKLYAFGSAPSTDQKLLLASTTSGDLTRWIANYIDGSEKRQKPELIRVLAAALRDKTKNCIFITNELVDAINCLETDSIRCVFLVDRLNQYDHLDFPTEFLTKVKSLVKSGRLFIMKSLDCVKFAPDPSNDTCC